MRDSRVKKTDLQQGNVTRLATGFQFVEGPVWHPDGHWLFSDIPASRIHKISPDGALVVTASADKTARVNVAMLML